MVVESNITGCIDPDTHKGSCGYSLANCPNEGCDNKLSHTQEVVNGECIPCTLRDAKAE